jgi:4-hydroxythreonine-4-phosphate dehydrogenase
LKKILYSPGEPSGIGPDLIIQMCVSNLWSKIKTPIVCLSDPKLIEERANSLRKKIKLNVIDSIDESKKNVGSTLQVIKISKCPNTSFGKLYKSNASYVLENLDYGVLEALSNKNVALVTGPISKENIISIKKNFSGHTEHIQKLTKSQDVLMLLASKELKVAIATTHIPLKKVSKLITTELIINKVTILNNELKSKFRIKKPKIKILGLNPHAGEGGKIGREEKDIMVPAIKKLRKEKVNVSMPMSADTAFTKKLLKETDAYLGMYHDQVLPVLKALSFGNSLNITLGVPIVRTSVDHGTALDIAGTGKADYSSLKEAIKVAENIL